MRKISEFKKSDPQRFWGIIIIISIVLISLIAGLFFSGKEEKKEKEEVVAVEIPVDTMLLNADNGSSTSGDDYFSVENSDDAIEDPLRVVNEEPVHKPIYGGSTYNPHPKVKRYNADDYTYKDPSPSNKSVEINNSALGSEVTAPKGRKRNPSDSFTVSGSAKAGKSSTCKVVIDNRGRTVKTGSTVYMHSSNEFTLGGITIPKNTMMQGVAQFSGERLKITVTQIKILNEYHNVAWKVFDSGVEGVYCPERLTDNIAKDGADEVIEGGNKVEANVPVIGSIKLNLKKKNNESSVILPDGYKLTLHE